MLKFETVESVIDALYRSLTFAPGVDPDYALMSSLFHPESRIIRPLEDTGGQLVAKSIETFISEFKTELIDEGVIASGGKEIEVERQISVFNRVAQVRSTYEFYLHTKEQPVARGVNMFQLIENSGRWWIVSLTWDRFPAIR